MNNKIYIFGSVIFIICLLVFFVISTSNRTPTKQRESISDSQKSNAHQETINEQSPSNFELSYSDNASFGTALSKMWEDGVSPPIIAKKATNYWIENFKKISGYIDFYSSDTLALQNLLKEYDKRQAIPALGDELLIKHLVEEIKLNDQIAHVGTSSSTLKSLSELKGAFAISLASSGGKELESLLSVLSNGASASRLDLLVYRIYREEVSALSDNLFQLSEEERAFKDMDIKSFGRVLNHTNPVARLILLDMLKRVPLNQNLEEFDRIIMSYSEETNSIVLMKFIEEAYYLRTESATGSLEKIAEAYPEQSVINIEATNVLRMIKSQ